MVIFIIMVILIILISLMVIMIIFFIMMHGHPDLAMLRRTPVTQAAVQRLNSRGWSEGASLEANLSLW